MLVGPEFRLAGLQQLGSFHHVLYILVLIEPVPQEAGEVAVLVSTDRGHAESGEKQPSPHPGPSQARG